MDAIKEPVKSTNGTGDVIRQDRQAEFLKRLNELQEELKIQLVPIIKTYPGGQQVPDLELILK